MKTKNKTSRKKAYTTSKSTSKSTKTKVNYDNNNNNNVVMISKPSAPRKMFYTNPKTAYHLSRSSFYNQEKLDSIISFIDDYSYDLNKGKTIDAKIIEQKLFNHEPANCICENISLDSGAKLRALNNDCACSNVKRYSSQGRSGASINSIECNGVKNILKVVPLSNYYIKKRDETKKYIFLEMDGFTLQTIINTFVYRELPLNTVSINNSGTCIKEKMKILGIGLGKSYMGYNLMEEANLGSGKDFIKKLIKGDLDDEFSIPEGAYGRDIRYKMVVNFLLQAVCIIGHLQASSLEFFHGDYKPDNVFVKRLETSETDYYHFNLSGISDVRPGQIPIKIRNMGFAVLIADFDISSITLKSTSDKIKKKYRLISPIKYKLLLGTSVNQTLKKYGNSDPEKVKAAQLDKFGISKIIRRNMDPTMPILRASGVRYFRDIDLYTFFIILISTENILEYVLEHKIDETIMSFMSDKFRKYLIKLKPKNIIMNASAYIALDILSKIKEPMPRIFTTKYIKSLEILNLHLFEPK